MPTININRKEFEELVGKKLPEEELKDRISMLGTDLEEVTKDEIQVEIFPNRPDMLSVQGFARAFSTFIGAKKGLSKFKVEKSGEKVIIEKGMEKVRPYTACAIIKGMKFDDQKIKDVIQIQEKLHITFGRNRRKAAIGIYPYEKIKPPIRFFAEDPKKVKFRPLEYPDEIDGMQILSKHHVGREYAHLMEGLDKFAFFEDSEGKILSMTPITNSHETGKITEDTTDVFIECSGFDFNVLSNCLNMVVTAFADMGGKIYSMDLEYPDGKKVTPDLEPKKMKLDVDYINKHLGLSLSKKEMEKLFEKMGYGIEGEKVLIPPYRADIMHEVDLAEDVAIAYGYENFEEEIPNVSTVGEESEMSKFQKLVANIMVGLGFVELNTYHLINKEMQTKLMNCEIKFVELENSLSKEHDTLRAWMIPSSLDVLKNNRHMEYPQKVFDMGSIFKLNDKTEMGVEEAIRLSVLITYSDADFTEIKQAMDYLLRMLGVEYKVIEVEHPSFIPGRVGRVVVDGEKVAYIGEIHPSVLENFELEMPVAALELNLSDLLELIKKK